MPSFSERQGYIPPKEISFRDELPVKLSIPFSTSCGAPFLLRSFGSASENCLVPTEQMICRNRLV